MSTNPAQPLIADAGTTLRREGRALIGWMTSEQGAIALAGGHQARAQDAGLLDRVKAARAAVASREAGADQDGIVNDHHVALPNIVQRLQAQENTQAFWNEGWSVAVVNLARVCSLQQAVASERARERVREVDPDDLSAIAGVTLPQASTTQLPAQFDEVRKVWIISAANPNLRITGQFGGELQPGTIGFGFTVGVLPSFLQVARHHGRYVLRDGYHRAFGLLARGITEAPAFVRDFGVGQLGISEGLFPTDVYLSERPPFLSDFLEDDVSADVAVPAVQKMVVVHGLELTPLA
jgi:hypothetical protein